MHAALVAIRDRDRLGGEPVLAEVLGGEARCRRARACPRELDGLAVLRPDREARPRPGRSAYLRDDPLRDLAGRSAPATARPRARGRRGRQPAADDAEPPRGRTESASRSGDACRRRRGVLRLLRRRRAASAAARASIAARALLVAVRGERPPARTRPPRAFIHSQMTRPIASMNVASPRPHMIAPESCWSASGCIPNAIDRPR